MKLLISALAAAIATTSPTPRNADIAWVASGEFCEPETVLPLPDDTLLVSNVCDFKKQGNGFLTLLDATGQTIDWRIVEGLDAPLGMTLAGNRLYVVDNNQVKVLHWPGYEPLETIALDTAVANDIAVAPDGTIYVSDTGKHQVIKRAPDGSQTVLTGESRFESANGLGLHGDYLYVGGARLWCINLADYSVKTIGPEWLADIDGIEFEAGGTLQITPVGGPLIRYRRDGSADAFVGKGISSANHGYSEKLKLAFIPTGFDNTVIAIRIM